MKTSLSQTQTRRGSVLVITLTVVVISGILLGSYLLLVQTQTASVARSQAWNSIIPVSEAGVEEAMSMINLNTPIVLASQIDTSSAWSWTNQVVQNGWSAWSNGVTTVTRYLSGSNYYTASININSGTPVVDSIGVVAYTSVPWTFTALPDPFLADVGNNFAAPATTAVGRHVHVLTRLTSLFPVGIVTLGTFDMNGNNCVSDSFDSTSTNYSTAGQWVLAKRKAGGDIGTDSVVAGDINLGNGNVYGKVHTGYGSSQTAVQIGPNGAVGDIAWNSSHTGIENGWWINDFNVALPDVPAPTFSGQALPSGGNGYGTILTGGNYTVTGGSAPSSVYVSGPSVLWVQGSFNPSAIDIATTNNASLIVYVGTANSAGNDSFSPGNNTINMPGYAKNLLILGLPSVKSVAFGGNGGFIAGIYAPEAAYSGGGGGENSKDSSGAMVVGSVRLNGHWNFHYDESLKALGPSRGWVGSSYTEIKWP